MPYNTGNPIPSSDAKDLSDNAENLDNSVNTALDTWTDRLGVERRTIQGQLKLLGYTAPDVYAGGIVFTVADNMATIERNKVIYAPLPSTIPFTTSGTWTADDEDKFFVVQGLTTSSDEIVLAADTVADMKTKDLQPGQFIRTKGYHTDGDGGGATYLIQTAAEFGGVPDGFGSITLSNGNIAVVQHNSIVDPRQYGMQTSVDSTSAFQALAANSEITKIVACGNKDYPFSSDVTFNHSIEITGDSTFRGTGAVLTIRGSLVEVGTVSANAAQGSNSATFTSIGSIVAGDLVVIHNQTASSFSPHRPEYTDGEFLVVESVSGNTLTFESSLLSTYLTSPDNKLFLVNSVTSRIAGVSVISTQSSTALRLLSNRDSELNLKEVRNEGAGSLSATSIEKSYKVKVGGKHYKDYQAAGFDYGIVISNSQYVDGEFLEAFGGRHGVTTGGDNTDGSVPCRFVRIKKSKVSNDYESGIYAADFHGNTADSCYDDCEIFGSVGMAGKNVEVKKSTVYQGAGYATPLAYHEFVGGFLKFTDVEVFCDSTTSGINIVSSTSSTIADDISEAYKVEVRRLKVNMTSNVTTIVNAFENSGQYNEWILDGLELFGNISGLTKIYNCSLDGAGVVSHGITFVNNLTNIPNSVELMATNVSYTGCLVTMPDFTFNSVCTLGIGDYISNIIQHNHPIFPDIPTNYLAHSGGSILGSGYAIVGSPIPSTVSSAFAAMQTGWSTHTSSVNKSYTVTSSVSMKNYKLP